MVNRLCRIVIRSFFVVVLSLVIAACGGGSIKHATKTAASTVEDQSGSHLTSGRSAREAVVARVGDVPITRAAVSHWMAALSGSEYYALAGKRVFPVGLISDPPDYRQCVARIEGVTAENPQSQKETGVQLLSKCRQLYQALKTQAMLFLVQTQMTLAEDRELGVSVTDKEVREAFNQTRRGAYPSEQELKKYLDARRLSLSDLLLETRMNLLARKMTQRVSSEGPHAVFAKLSKAGLKWNQKTTCSSGYLVEHCREFKGRNTYPNSPPASVMLEELTAVLTGRCYNPAVCTNSQ